jgi:hypothetical protein
VTYAKNLQIAANATSSSQRRRSARIRLRQENLALRVEFDMAAHELNLKDGKIAIYRKILERKRRELQLWREKIRAASTSLPSS